MPRKKVSKTADEVRKLKRESEKRRRERIKADPIKYAEQKEKQRLKRLRRKAEIKDLCIADLTERGKRIQRKKWRERAQKSRMNKKIKEAMLRPIQEDSPPSTDCDEEFFAEPQALPKNNREQAQSPSILPAESPPTLCAMPSSPHSPRNTPRRYGSPSSVSSADTESSRQKLVGLKIANRNKVIRNRIIEQQKAKIELLKTKIHTLSMKVQRSENSYPLTPKRLTPQQLKFNKNKMNVQRFLQKDENSTLCPGKNYTITRCGKMKQKRYLCDTLENLHKKYNTETGKPISYSTFTRFRPFWIVSAKVIDRDTCACYFHENVKLILEKLRQLRLIQEKSVQDVCDSVTCNRTKLHLHDETV